MPDVEPVPDGPLVTPVELLQGYDAVPLPVDTAGAVPLDVPGDSTVSELSVPGIGFVPEGPTMVVEFANG